VPPRSLFLERGRRFRVNFEHENNASYCKQYTGVLFIANISLRACDKVSIKSMYRDFNDPENNNATNNCLLLELNYVSLIKPSEVYIMANVYYINTIFMVSRLIDTEKR
jgi:hypothetical protein